MGIDKGAKESRHSSQEERYSNTRRHAEEIKIKAQSPE
jgi:hypothetical protein